MTDNLNALSYEELKEQARILGVPVKGNTDTLRSNIQAALDGEEPEVVAESPKKEPKKKDPKANWITIQIAEKEGDNQPVFVGHNGRAYYIRRGEPVQVPPHVVDVLKHANQQVRASNGEWKSVPSKSYREVTDGFSNTVPEGTSGVRHH